MLPKSVEPMVAPQFITLEDLDEDRRVGRPSWDRVDHRGHLSWGRREDRSSSDREDRRDHSSWDRREDHPSSDREDRLSLAREALACLVREVQIVQALPEHRPRPHRPRTWHRSGGIPCRFL